MKIDGRLLDLAGRTAAVIGGDSGIGLDLAREDMGVVIMSMKRPQDASWGLLLAPNRCPHLCTKRLPAENNGKKMHEKGWSAPV